jgi:hypothetical protein
MSRIVIVILIYNRHKPIDVVYFLNFLDTYNTYESVIYRPTCGYKVDSAVSG